MLTRAALAVLIGVALTPAARAQIGQNPFNLPDLKLPVAGLGNNYLPPLPGQPMGAFMPPPGTNLLNGQFSGMHNAWGAQTPWPFQNPFTPAHWNFQGMYGGGFNPWGGAGMWTAPPFGQYGYNGAYQGFAPIVGANNGWFPYDAGWGGNAWGGMGMGGFGTTGFGLPGMGMPGMGMPGMGGFGMPGMGMGNGFGGPMMFPR